MIVQVALPITVEKRFSYSVPDRWQPYALPYSRVIVPFRNRNITGFITGTGKGETGGLKEIHEVYDIVPLLTDSLAGLCEWASLHYVTPLGMVLKYALPSSLNIEKHLVVRGGHNLPAGLEGMSLRKAYDMLGKNTVFNLFRQGSLSLQDTCADRPFQNINSGEGNGQGHVHGGMTHNLFVGNVRDRLAYYMSRISDCLTKGRSVLMLLPDYYVIGDYFFRVFRKEFPEKVLWYGSRIQGKARMETYFSTRSDGGFLIMGNKSCTFLPVADSGLIIVERPEEDHYRNEEGFKFHGATLALRRARIEGIHLIYGTPSPSMEIARCMDEGMINVVSRPSSDIASYFEITLEKSPASYDPLPEDLVDIIREGVAKNERIAIYTPRKDFSSYIQCIECKTLFVCRHCNGILTYHKEKNLLVCGSCGRKEPYEEQCPQCGGCLIRFSRIGAEYLEECLVKLFPGHPVIKITGDTAKKKAARIHALSGKSPWILVGTQTMGSLYDLKVDTLILLGWEELSRISGYRASEKMFHVLHHMLDALSPETIYCFIEQKKRVGIRGFFDINSFQNDELSRRKNADFPPYTRLFLVEVEKRTESSGIKTVDTIREMLKSEGYTGPFTGPLYLKKDRHLWRIVLKGNEESLCSSLLRLYDFPDVRVEADPLYL